MPTHKRYPTAVAITEDGAADASSGGAATNSTYDTAEAEEEKSHTSNKQPVAEEAEEDEEDLRPVGGEKTYQTGHSRSSSSFRAKSRVNTYVGFFEGDRVRVLKEGHFKDKYAVVVDPKWSGRVKVKLDGEVKSYYESELVVTYRESEEEQRSGTRAAIDGLRYRGNETKVKTGMSSARGPRAQSRSKQSSKMSIAEQEHRALGALAHAQGNAEVGGVVGALASCAIFVAIFGEVGFFGIIGGAVVGWVMGSMYLAHAPDWLTGYYSRVLPSPPPRAWEMKLEKSTDKKSMPMELGHFKPGEDFCGRISTVQMISLVFIFIGFSSIDSQGTTNSVAEQLANNQFSFEMVAGVFIQLLFIIFERVAYLHRSLRMRLLLQYTAIIVLHVSVIFVLPKRNREFLPAMPGLVVFYLLQCVYLYLGACQIRQGFVVFPLQPSSYTAHGFGGIPAMLFTVYFAIPFLFEMNSLLDWCCSSTSLDVAMWLQMEEIYAQLFKNCCAMNDRRENASVLQGHRSQPTLGKFVNGALTFSLLVCLLVMPLFLFSNKAPASVNDLLTLSMTLSFVAFGQPMVVYEDTMSVTTSGPGLRREKSYSLPGSPTREGNWVTQVARFQSFSTNQWQISLPARNRLVQELKSAQSPLINGSAYGNWELVFQVRVYYNARFGSDTENQNSFSFCSCVMKPPHSLCLCDLTLYVCVTSLFMSV
jgi:hypothetical protein